ncbi:MAG: invasion associated locus B family protein [Azospirillum sp.]|nr:invasion associated locus B family protein [Azospirillum sp.]
MKKIGLLAFCSISLLAFSAYAGAPQLIGEYDDWSAYIYKEGKNSVCYMASTPQKSEGKYTRRGDVYLVITHRPADKSFDVVNFVAGYAYKNDAKVIVKIGKDTISDFFVENDKAWTMNANVDKKLVEAMKKGERLIIDGTSTKGTTTKDTYSLRGFSSAYRAISTKCRR